MRPALEPEALARALQVYPKVLALFEHSPLHFLQSVQMFFDRVFPSLLNGQFRLLMQDGKPLSFVNWAWVSPQVSAQLVAGRNAIGPDEWQGGPDLWFMEIVARDGLTPALVRDLQKLFPPGTRARWMRIGPSGEVQGIGEVRMPGRAAPPK